MATPAKVPPVPTAINISSNCSRTPYNDNHNMLFTRLYLTHTPCKKNNYSMDDRVLRDISYSGCGLTPVLT